jgi:hypothetical protein
MPNGEYIQPGLKDDEKRPKTLTYDVLRALLPPCASQRRLPF